MATWKKVLVAGDETNNNIGSANLTIPNSTDRLLDLLTSSSVLQIRASDDAALLYIRDSRVELGSTADCVAAHIKTTGSKLELGSTKLAQFKKTNELKIVGVADGSAAGPILKLIRDEDAEDGAADGDKIGQIQMWGDTNAETGGLPAVSKQYASIQAIASETELDFIDPNVINDSAGRLNFDVRVGGSDTLVTGLSIEGVDLDLFAEIKENDFTISSASTGDVNGPNLILKKTDADPSDNEKGGKIIFQAEGSDSEFKDYASISAEHQDVTNNSEDGTLLFNVLRHGVEAEAFRIKGQDLNARLELKGTTFMVRGDETAAATAAPTLDLQKLDFSPLDNAKVGQITFSSQSDDGDGTVSTVNYGSILVNSSEVDTDDVDGKMNFNVSISGAETTVMTIGHDGGGAASDSFSANEQKLRGVEVHGTDLETLTRRNLITIQCGENGTITAEDGGTANSVLRMANGVSAFSGSDLDDSLGIMLPFGGYIAGGSFMCRRQSAVTQEGRVRLFVRKVFANGQDPNFTEHRIASTDGDLALESNIRSTAYTVEDSIHRQDAYKFEAGDVIVPFMRVEAEDGDTVEIDDVIAQIFIYTEAIVA